MAQKDSILVVGRDTVAYRYTPIENTSTKKQSGDGWRKFVRYIAESSVDSSFERKVDMTFVENNGLVNPDRISVGQKLLILTPTRTYTVRGGDTLEKISRRFGVGVRRPRYGA